MSINCIHGMTASYCSYCNVGRRLLEAEKMKRLGLARRVNAKLDAIGRIPAGVLRLLLAGELSLVATKKHKDTLKDQWLVATGTQLYDDQMVIDDVQREKFGTGCWYWHAKVTFSATHEEADEIKCMVGVNVRSISPGHWVVSSNTLALFLGSKGMKPVRRA